MKFAAGDRLAVRQFLVRIRMRLRDTVRTFFSACNFQRLFRQVVFFMTSASIVYAQILSTVLMLATLPVRPVYAYDEIIPPQNVRDNPIPHIDVDPSSGQTHLDRAQNGTPVININAPTAGGVSVNYYRDFNVTDENLIFNNLKGEAGNSVLGGSLHGNPNFNQPNAQAADIIMNEVVSGRTTNIKGYVEVFGKKADLVIANANGIMVSGGGFINTGRLSLITGQSNPAGAVNANGNLNPFVLSENPNAIITVVGRNFTDAAGNVVAYNLGIDAMNADYVDLISRVVKINGDIYAGGGLNIKTGNDLATYNAVTREFDVSSADKTDKPEFSIDSTALGGIYAGRINIIATENGVGVRARSDLVAQVDDIAFDVDGNIVLENTASIHAKRNLNIKSSDTVTNNTMVVAEGGADIRAKTVENNDTVYAIGNLVVSADTLENVGLMTTGRGDADFTVASIVNANELSSGGKLSLLTDDLNNDAGLLMSNGNMTITFNTPTDYTITGKLYSNNGLTITADNISNLADLLAANNVIINATGEFYNGTEAVESEIIAFNNALFNVGNLYNYGTILANNTISINATDGIYNGSDTVTNARLSAGNVLSMTAGTRIINRGYLEAMNGLSLISLAVSNDDYKLNDVGSDVASRYIVSPEVQAQLDNLSVITDIETLVALSLMVYETADFDNIQKRIRAIYIDQEIAGIKDLYVFDADYFTVGAAVPVTRVDAETGAITIENLTITESMVQEQLQEILGALYNADDWTVDANDAAAVAARLDAIQNIFDTRLAVADFYENTDWSALTEAETQTALAAIMASDYAVADWALPPMPPLPGSDATRDYLKQLRLDNRDIASTEQTGIHNYGRIFSAYDMGLYSNSVLHNNTGALIYADGNIDFGIDRVLFNNENALGQGIYAGGMIDIHGNTSDRLEQLINYDGRIEAEGNIFIKAVDTVNYGSDSVNIFSDPYTGAKYTDVFLGNAGLYQTKIYQKRIYESTLTTGESAIVSNAGTLGIDSTNRVLNYNSLMFADNVVLVANHLMNLVSEFTVQNIDYQHYHGKKCKWTGHCSEYYGSYKQFKHDVLLMPANSLSAIAARNTLSITANTLDNGTSGLPIIDENSVLDPDGRLPYAPTVETATAAEQLAKTGTLNPADRLTLPSGNYGMFRRPADPNAHYLYETDPALIDLSHFLGSQYLMNRLGMDPYGQDLKFLGDAYFEFKMIRNSLEQISYFQSNIFTDAELERFINGMYENVTSDLRSKLKLEFGTALTPAQIKQLDTDIVWYVWQKITLPDGTVVEALVPQVYLGQSTQSAVNAGVAPGSNTASSIRGNDVFIVALDPNKRSVLDNAGTISGTRQLSVSMDHVNNISSSIGGPQASLIAGDLLHINTKNATTGVDGVLNNLGGFIGTTNADSLMVLSTGELNNITMTQQERRIASDKGYDYRAVDTYVGKTAQIVGGGDLLIQTSGDMNMVGSAVSVVKNAQLDINGDLNVLAAQDYTYETQTMTRAGGKFIGETMNKTDTTESMRNIVSSIQAGNDLNIAATGDILSIGGTFAAGNDLSMSAENIRLLNAMDSDYEYHYEHRERFDVLGAAAFATAAALTGGTAGILASAQGAVNMKMGTTDSFEKYGETALGSTLSGNNINLFSNKDTTFVSANINAANDFNLLAVGNVFVGTAQEKHYQNESHVKFGGEIFSAALNGALTGVVANVAESVAQGFIPFVPMGSTLVGGAVGSMVIDNGGKDVKSEHTNNIESLLQQSSNVNAGGNIYVQTGLNTTLQASNIVADGDVSLVSGGDLNIVNAIQTESTYKKDFNKGFDGLFAEYNEGQISVGSEFSKTEKSNTTTTTTSVGSSISGGGNVNLAAQNNITQIGSDVYSSGGDIAYFTKEGDILISSGQNTLDSHTKEDDMTLRAGVKVGNAYVDVGYAAKHLVEAGEKVKDATEELNRMRKLESEGKASKEAVADAVLNLAMANLNLANATIAMVSSAAGAATAASSSFGTGFYGSAFMDVATNRTTTDENSTSWTRSNVVADMGNITFSSGNDMTQTGANVFAGNGRVTYDIANDLLVMADADKYAMTMESKSFNAGVSVGNNAVQVSLGMGESTSKTRSTTYENAAIYANEIVVRTGNDATFKGANVTAQTIAMDIGGDLNLESLQDTYYSKARNWSVSASAGIGINGGGNSGGGGFSVGSDYTDSSWVNNQTSIIAEQGMTINVGKNTDIKGAILATGYYDDNGVFHDAGNLNLNTGSLTYSNLSDFYKTESTAFGFSTNIGSSTDKKTASEHPTGSTTVTMKHTGQEKEQTTYATIGLGNITVGGNTDPDLDGLNRDVNNAQVITKDMITGALDGSVTVDNRLFTSDGRASISKDFKNFGSNIKQMGKGLRNNIVTKSIENAYTDDKKDIIDTVKDYIELDRQQTELQKKKEDLVNKLNGMTNLDAPAARDALQELVDLASQGGGFEGKLNLASVDGNVIGLAYQSADGTEKTITLNLKNVNLADPNALMNAVYHETTNFDDHRANEQTATNRGDTAAGIWDLKNYGNENTNKAGADSTSWVAAHADSAILKEGEKALYTGFLNAAADQGYAQPQVTKVFAEAMVGTGLGYAKVGYLEFVKNDNETLLEANARLTQEGDRFIGTLDGTGLLVKKTSEVIDSGWKMAIDDVDNIFQEKLGVKGRYVNEYNDALTDVVRDIVNGAKKILPENVQIIAETTMTTGGTSTMARASTEVLVNTAVKTLSSDVVAPKTSTIIVTDDVVAKLPVGRSGQSVNNLIQNTETVIGNRTYSGHALDQMMERGLTPTVVENTISTSKGVVNKVGDKVMHYDPVNNVSVVVNKNGNVVTTVPGKITNFK